MRVRRASRPLALAAALALLAPAAAAATVKLVEISNATADESTYMNAFDAPATAIADFDGDGRAEIVSHNENRVVYVLASASADVLAEIRPPYPAGWSARALTDPAVGDVNGNGRLDVVVVTSAADVCAYEFTGGSSSGSMSFARLWCRHMRDYSAEGADGGPWVEDVNGDGRAEVFGQQEQKGLYALNGDGSVRWSKAEWGGNAGPVVADVDRDGRKDVLFFSDGGTVRAYDAQSGAAKWTFWAGAHVQPASIPVAGSVGDIDGDGSVEVVFSARDAHDATNFANDHLMIFALNGENGGVQWRVQPSWAWPLSYTHPVLVDANGDGRRDVVMQDWNTIGHKPGNWERLGPAHVFALNGPNGALLWRTDLDNSWSNDDLAVADVDGDGAMEVMAIGYGAGGDGVWYLSLGSGAKEQHVAVPGWTAYRGPVVGDWGGNGGTRWALPVYSGSKGGGLVVFDAQSACRVAYGGWQNRNACDPPSGSGGTAPPPPPPPGGAFDATFSGVAGNNWWVQVTVTANEAVAGVDARVNGGSWIPLTKQSWGGWAKSFHVPTGSAVEFQARSASGAVDVSERYGWPPGTAPPPPPPPGGSFSATFSNVKGNNWWVEAAVSGSEPIAGVDARVNGGGWVPLAKQSWGAWAKSFHVPTGAKVQFQARSTSGAVALSGEYAWPPGSAPPPPSGSFTASFSNVKCSDWWVQATVSASSALSGVNVRMNGGSWIALENKGWGWAKSFRIASGSTVQFQAVSTAGDAATSGTFTCPR